MLEQDYVDFCNLAFDLREQAEAFFAAMSDEHLYRLAGAIRHELAACPSGKVEPAWDFLAAILHEKIEARENPLRNVVQMPKRSADVVPF